jgi:hypothetical protein
LDFDVNVENVGKLVRVIRKKGKDMVPMGLSAEGRLTIIRVSVMTSNPTLGGQDGIKYSVEEVG